MTQRTVMLFGTGAIAKGYAIRFAQEGCRLVLVSWDDSCDKLSQELKEKTGISSDNMITPHADLSQYANIADVYQQAYEAFGQVDAVVNGSGGNQAAAVVSSLEDFVNMDASVPDSLMKNNYFSKRYSLQIYAKWLREKGHQGSVVNITSMSGITPLSKVIDYSAAFAAVENFTQSVAFLYAKHNLGRVNNVAVGFTIGRQNKKLLLDDNDNPTPRGQEILDSTSQHRFLDVEEIAEHVVYLLDPEKCRAVNGHTLRVDGGFNLVNLPSTA